MALFRARDVWRQAVGAVVERQDRREFAAFHRGLVRRQDILYMFFTSDLLHWLDRALACVPPAVNLVLIGSDLSADELAWIRSRYRRPFHHIRSRVDDNTVLDLAFRAAAGNFGWLHVDCFVLNPRLFQEMADLPDDVVANCIWSHPAAPSATGAHDGPGASSADGAQALHSAFVFINYGVIRALRRRGLLPSPCSHHYQGAATGRTVTRRKLYSRVPRRRHVAQLARVLPPGADGLPQYPQRGNYFQVLVVFQLVANALGYRLRQVRDLRRDGTGSAANFSNEIVHVNGVATYKSYRDDATTIGGRFYPLLLQADYVMLAALGDDVPPRYRQLRGELETELTRLRIPVRAARRNLGAFLAERGIAPDRAALILGKPEASEAPVAPATPLAPLAVTAPEASPEAHREPALAGRTSVQETHR